MTRWRKVKKEKKSDTFSKKKVSFNPVSIKERLKAFLIDTFMITMPIFYITIYLIMGSREEFRDNMATGWIYIIFSHFSIVVLFWSKLGQTPGLKAYSIKIVKEGSVFENPSYISSVVRYICMQISIFSVIGNLMAFFRKDKKTFHDLVSVTKLIKVNE
jgi:uncharacterized RDD family membrane protein YckC